MKTRRSCLPLMIFSSSLVLLGIVGTYIYIPLAAGRSFGKPSATLNAWQRFSYAFELISNEGDLTQPRQPGGTEQLFVIEEGETALSISNRLEQEELITNARIFRAYLVWTGMDAYLQTGTFRLSPALSAESIAGMLQSTTLSEVSFTILPGWRMEEIAAALPTSGLNISPEDFLKAALVPGIPAEFLPPGVSAEGFLFPDRYILPRSTSADQLVAILLQQFALELIPELQAGFSTQGLTVFQAVTLASIIQREAMLEVEMPTIASVFYNRLAINMNLQTDPTVQYAIGYNSTQGTWWTNPLSAGDLQTNSSYNTYLHPGLPPGPISNPGLAALMAVAHPARTEYYFFQAKCDGSGLHNFFITFEEHQQNYCP